MCSGANRVLDTKRRRRFIDDNVAMRVVASLTAAIILLGACGSATSVDTGARDGRDDTASTPDDQGASDDDAESNFEDLPEDSIELPPAGFILEPANAQLDDLDGWVAVDEWYWEPIGVAGSDCPVFDEVMYLEEWGIITSFWLKDGTELFHFTAELNTAENVADYVDAFTSVAVECPSATFDRAQLSFTPFRSGGLDGFTMTVAGPPSSNWLLESDTVSSAVITSRNNVVSVLQIVPTAEFDMSQFEELAQRSIERLDAVAPETSPSPDADLVELEAEAATRTPDCRIEPGECRD